MRILEFGQIDALSKLQATYDEFLADRAAIVRAGDTETRTFNTEELQDILDDCVTAIIKGKYEEFLVWGSYNHDNKNFISAKLTVILTIHITYQYIYFFLLNWVFEYVLY